MSSVGRYFWPLEASYFHPTACLNHYQLHCMEAMAAMGQKVEVFNSKKSLPPDDATATYDLHKLSTFSAPWGGQG